LQTLAQSGGHVEKEQQSKRIHKEVALFELQTLAQCCGHVEKRQMPCKRLHKAVAM